MLPVYWGHHGVVECLGAVQTRGPQELSTPLAARAPLVNPKVHGGSRPLNYHGTLQKAIRDTIIVLIDLSDHVAIMENGV